MSAKKPLLRKPKEPEDWKIERVGRKDGKRRREELEGRKRPDSNRRSPKERKIGSRERMFIGEGW